MKILIVDDDPTTRKLLTLYLKGKGYEVVSAENGIDGLERLGRENVNLVISDLNMPYMDGIEFVKTVKANESFRHIPVLMVTTEQDPEERQRALSAGAHAYLVKPVTADVLAQQIRAIVKTIFTQGGNPHA